jgi:hypothetical protein
MTSCEAPGCGRDLPKGRRRFCSDLCRVRGHRAERTRDSGEWARGLLRQVRSVGRRAAADPEEFAVLWEVRAEADEACTVALDGLRSHGYSWAHLASIAGITRQAIQQWRARRPDPPTRNEPLTTERTQHHA